MKTLKREEIYANAYENLEHLRANLEIFLEQYYNQQRLHSALGYRSPEEFERQASAKVRLQMRRQRRSLSSLAWLHLLRGCWSRGLKRRPLLQTSSPLEKLSRRLHERANVPMSNCLTSGVHLNEKLHVCQSDLSHPRVHPRAPCPNCAHSFEKRSHRTALNESR
jgi:hypothetical protein